MTMISSFTARGSNLHCLLETVILSGFTDGLLFPLQDLSNLCFCGIRLSSFFTFPTCPELDEPGSNLISLETSGFSSFPSQLS